VVESVLLLGVITSICLLLSLTGFRAGGVLGVIFVGQSIYWFISYVLRPAVLLIYQPKPGVGDSVADWRIAAGGYDIAMPYILQPIVWGLAAYMLLALGITRFLAPKLRMSQHHGLEADRSTTFVLAYVTGWAFRALSELVGSSAALETLSGLAVVGAAGLIVFSSGNSRYRVLLIGGAIGGELLWSLLSASKTPVIASGLALALRWAIAGWTKKKIVLSLTIGAVGVLAFPALQSVKTSVADAYVLNAATANYPPIVQPLMSLIRRFDLFSATTDATLLGPANWLSAEEFLNRIATSFIPQFFLAQSKIGVGTLWSTEVRAASLNVANNDVSLAEGFIAEGYALNGLMGVIFGAIFVSVFAVLVTLMIKSTRLFMVSLGLLLVSFPVLFERGILGTVEGSHLVPRNPRAARALQAIAKATTDKIR